MRINSYFLILPVALFLIISSILNPQSLILSFAAQNKEEREVLESQLSELENQISNYEITIEQYKKQGKSLQSEVKLLESKIAKLNLQIKAVELTLKKLDSEIAGTQGQINQTESNIDFNKENLSKLLQILYENDKQSLVEILFKNPQLSDFFGDLNNMMAVQDNLRIVIEKIIEARQKLVDQKEILALEREDAAALKAYQDSQKANIKKTQSDKNNLLKITKGKESEYQKILVETKKSAAEIRKQIFKMLGGGELPFEEAVKIAKFAEKATGIRAAFILAVLTQESAIKGVIGANLGKCYYNTAMSNSQKPVFLALMSELGLDPAKTPVSCPIVSDGNFGGAMGPAQFMPTTWKIYKARITEITGNNPVSPFNNADAFTGTALYLKDGMSGCKTLYKTIFSQENCAAAKYYAGNNWSSYIRVGRYGYRVAERAEKFADDIAILDAN